MNPTATALLDAVDRVIAEHGPSGVTLRRVEAEAGLSHTAAAHYFHDKPGSFTAYITRAWNQVADGVEQAAALDDDRRALLAAARSYAEFAEQHPSAFSVMSRLELTHSRIHATEPRSRTPRAATWPLRVSLFERTLNLELSRRSNNLRSTLCPPPQPHRR